jgi:DNA topoisomerase IA
MPQLTQPLLGKKKLKIAQGFNDKKVTDHHAIIPTGFKVICNTISSKYMIVLQSVLLPFL